MKFAVLALLGAVSAFDVIGLAQETTEVTNELEENVNL